MHKAAVKRTAQAIGRAIILPAADIDTDAMRAVCALNRLAVCMAGDRSYCVLLKTTDTSDLDDVLGAVPIRIPVSPSVTLGIICTHLNNRDDLREKLSNISLIDGELTFTCRADDIASAVSDARALFTDRTISSSWSLPLLSALKDYAASIGVSVRVGEPGSGSGSCSGPGPGPDPGSASIAGGRAVTVMAAPDWEPAVSTGPNSDVTSTSTSTDGSDGVEHVIKLLGMKELTHRVRLTPHQLAGMTHLQWIQDIDGCMRVVPGRLETGLRGVAVAEYLDTGTETDAGTGTGTGAGTGTGTRGPKSRWKEETCLVLVGWDEKALRLYEVCRG